MSAWKQTKTKSEKHKQTRGYRSRCLKKNFRSSQSDSNARAFDELRDWFLPDERIFAGLKLHGNTKWLPVNLVWLALCWAWAESKHVTDAFDTALVQSRQLGVAALSTYQGLMEALVRWTGELMSVLWPVVHQRLREIGGALFEFGGFVPIAFDGSRSTAPRTVSNERALCAANYGNGKTAKYRKKKSKGMRRRKNEKCKPQPQEPQAWITLLWHMRLRVTWMWRLGPSNSSERSHVMAMLDDGDFPKNTLFCGDAGFVGYPLWSQILAGGFDFLVRVGANVHLLAQSADYTIQVGGGVWCWPKHAMQSGLPALRLRLVKVTIGRTQMWMLTSVLQSSRLRKSQIAKLYKMRWGIEVEFRGLKQTLDRAKLRCRNEQRVLAELNWSIMAMVVAELFALKEQLAVVHSPPNACGPPGDPQKRSLARTLRALRGCLKRLKDAPEPGRDLRTQLCLAVTDSYKRKSSKRARYRPPNPDKKPLGHPKIHKLNMHEKKMLKSLPPQETAT